MMIELSFWLCVALVIYAYAGYPCALAALSIVRRRDVRKQAITPRVCFIITAYNEERRIREKIENTLRQAYPADRLEVVVASDCSTDGTDDIALEYAPYVRVVRSSARRGKEAAQQLAIQSTTADILVFSDVATALPADAISNIVSNFDDATVGCVSSVDRFVDDEGRTSGEGAYVRYEMWLRNLESRVNSLVGLSGSFFAARRIVCLTWAADRQSDFGTLLNAIGLGLRGVLDRDAAGYYRNIVDGRRERQRKVRTVVRGIAVLADHVHLLNPFRYGLFAWQLASHKLCRWLVPFGMIGAAATNVVLAFGHHPSGPYRILLAAQVAFYTAALVGAASGSTLIRVPSFLVSSNFAILTAWLRYVRGERMTLWNPSERLSALPGTGAR